MESYGDLLRKTREAKNLDIERVSREITVDKKYLVGLEEEDSGVFPGEAYLTGYLRNYANYLEIDSEYILRLYHNKQVQESPVPEGLIQKPRGRIILPVIIIPIVALLLAGGIFALVFGLTHKKKPEEGVVISYSKKNAQYEMTDKKLAKRVYKGDQFIIPTEKGKIILTVRDTLGSLGLDTPAGIFYVELSEEAEVDIDGDTISDMIVYVSDISSINEECGAEISMLLRKGSPVSAYAEVDVDSIPLATDFKAKQVQKVILEDNRAYPFTIKASFRGPCLFRDKVDREKSVEAYFSKGELFTATPHNGIRLWISNANAVNFTVVADGKTFDLGMGSAGEVLVEDIKWIKDTDGRYKLVVIDLE